MIHIKYRVRKYTDKHKCIDTTQNAIYPTYWIDNSLLYCKDGFSTRSISLDDLEEIAVGDTVIILGRYRTPERVQFIKDIFPYFIQLNDIIETKEKRKRGDN